MNYNNVVDKETQEEGQKKLRINSQVLKKKRERERKPIDKNKQREGLKALMCG